MVRFVLHAAAVLTLTAITQLGGIAWVVALAFRRRRWAVFVLAYALIWGAAQLAAPQLGRVPLPCRGEPLRMQSAFYCIAMRNFVGPELRDGRLRRSSAPMLSRWCRKNGSCAQAWLRPARSRGAGARSRSCPRRGNRRSPDPGRRSRGDSRRAGTAATRGDTAVHRCPGIRRPRGSGTARRTGRRRRRSRRARGPAARRAATHHPARAGVLLRPRAPPQAHPRAGPPSDLAALTRGQRRARACFTYGDTWSPYRSSTQGSRWSVPRMTPRQCELPHWHVNSVIIGP